MTGKLKVTQIRSGIGSTRKQLLTLRGLGLNKMHRTVILQDTREIRGMIIKIQHLVRVEAGQQE